VSEAPWVEESTWMRISLLLIYGLYRARIYTVLVSMVVASHFYIAVTPTILIMNWQLNLTYIML
jgi:hypothetical protein